jgi:hypothetical protein
MDIYEGCNQLLGAIGEIPITDNTQALEADATSDVGIARDTLLRMSKSIQQEGYWFNTEKGYPMVPNTDGYIPISNSILSIYSSTIIVKDHKLYNTEKRTYIFEDTQEIDVVFEVQFDDLPYVVADVIVMEATTVFYNNILGDTQELRILETNAQRAQISLQKAQMKHKKANLISGSKLLNRTQNPIGLI